MRAAKVKRRMRQLPMWEETPLARKRGSTLHVRLTDEQHAEVAARAKRSGLSLSKLVRFCLAKPGLP